MRLQHLYLANGQAVLVDLRYPALHSLTQVQHDGDAGPDVGTQGYEFRPLADYLGI
jgi:hypothetical protein